MLGGNQAPVAFSLSKTPLTSVFIVKKRLCERNFLTSQRERERERWLDDELFVGANCAILKEVDLTDKTKLSVQIKQIDEVVGHQITEIGCL